jgi:hypothetical protein
VYLLGEGIKTSITSTHGEYRFHLHYTACDSIPDSIIIRPELDKYIYNGISTADLVGIIRHLLSKEEFRTYYSYIAADLNKSGHVSIGDVAILRKLILGKISDLKSFGQDSWQFVSQKEVLDSSNWYSAAPEIKRKFIPSGFSEDFYGIKIGDINGDARFSGSSTNTIRNQRTAIFAVEQNESGFSILARDDDSLSGFQASFIIKNASGFLSASVSKNAIEGAYFNILNDNEIRVVWYHPEGESIEVKSGQKLFSVEGHMQEISDMDVVLNPDFQNVIIHEDLSSSTIELANVNTRKDVSIYPNPTNAGFKIGFRSSQSSIGEVLIIDDSGVELVQRQFSLIEGYNSLEIEESVFAESVGLFFVRLKSDDYVKTFKLLKLK